MTLELWKTILLSIVAICGGFSTVCVSVGWLIKIYHALKKPSENTKARFDRYDKMFDNDHKEIQELRSQFAFILKALPILLQDDLVILNHLRTDNNTGKMQKQEDKIHEFLLERQ